MKLLLKECISCNNKILIKSKKCEYCNAYQSVWKNRCVTYAPVSSTFIALLALTITLTPFVIDKYASKSAEVAIEVLDAKDGVLELFASNIGNKGAVLGDIKLSYDVVNQNYCRRIDLKLDIASRIVSSNDEAILTTKTDSFLPYMVSLLPLTEQEREEYELYKTDKKKLDLVKQLDYESRSKVTICSLEFRSKSLNVKFVSNPISYNCVMTEEPSLDISKWY